jgi:hypothetical protein
MWDFFAATTYTLATLASHLLPVGTDHSGDFAWLATSVSWLKANDRLLPVQLGLANLAILLTWLGAELALRAIVLAVRLKTWVIKAVTWK